MIFVAIHDRDAFCPPAEKTSPGNTSNETEARKQIEIQSGCQWDKDRKKVLEALCRRMNQNRLSQCFCIGPYRIRPVAKIFMRKPSGSLVTYRVHISKPSQASDNDEDEFDDSDEEKHAYKSLDEDFEAEEEDGQIEEPEMQFGVTPFMSGVLPAGRLRAMTKPVGCQAYGLIQVNGKSYNQARLLLGNMGSLHPANRLAAYITGRLYAPADTSHKNSQQSDPTNKINAPGTLHIKAAGTVVPPIITARKTTELKTPTQPPVQQSQPDSLRKGSTTLPQHSQISSTTSLIQMSCLQHSSVSPFQNSSTSSPVSLTVSPSLKTPSFLGQSGTYSFRICPPANNGTGGQNLPGVSLPGGFTLIQLPKPARRSESVNTPKMAAVDKALPPKDSSFNCGHFVADSDANWLGLDTFTGAKDLLSNRSVEPGSSPELMCDEKMLSDESNEANSRQVDSNLDIATEDLSSDSSDYCGEVDEDTNEEVVDIETVEEVRQGMAIAKMKEAVRKALEQSRDSSDDFRSARDLSITDQMDNKRDGSKNNRRRRNHSVLEKQRRSEQRTLFDKLQVVLKTDPRAPRLRLLSLALKEIQNLVETSKYLEEKKRRLTRLQSVYLKELSLLSGKSDKLIKHKLKEICERQKIREKTKKWRPFFSQLLQSRAALLQTTTPQSKPRTTPLLQPDFFMTPSQANPLKSSPAAQNGVDQTPMPIPPSVLPAVSSPAQVEVTAASPQAENEPGEPGATARVSLSSSQTECQSQVPAVTATLQVTTAEDEASPTSSTPNSNKPSFRPSQSVTFPLIRSKTGRIILPSSLKRLGQGFYTLVVMNPKKKGENGEVSMQPSDVDQSRNREKSFSISDQPTDSESSRILEEERTEQSSNSEPKRSPALLNKSTFVPLMAPQAVENSQEGGAVLVLNKTPAAPSGEPQPDGSTPVVRRGRGRPRKYPITPISENEQRTVVKDTNKSASPQVKDGQSQNITLKLAKDTPGTVRDIPVLVKRCRGRPPKKKSAQRGSPPITRAGSSPLRPNKDSPVRLSRSFTSPDTKPKESPAATTLLGEMNTSRPLTRGALGKDFPSAKKRSWIDVEKELEPELESE